jgi:hypothetical protein
LSLLTLGLENECSSPSSSSLDSSVAARNRPAEACGYGIAVVGMQDQWLLLALTAAKAPGPAITLLEAGPLHQLGSDFG